VAKNTNKNKAQHAIIFEAVALALAVDGQCRTAASQCQPTGELHQHEALSIWLCENKVYLAEVPAVINTIHRSA